MAKVIITDERYPEGMEGVMGVMAELSGILIKADGERRDLGVLSRKVVTDDFVEAIVDALQANSTTNGLANFKYHGTGTGTNAEDATDTALQTEIEYAATPNREEGTSEEGASANIYKTVATITYEDTHTVTEHGIFNANGDPTDGTLMDRSVWAGTEVEDTDTIQFTYQLTFTAGS